MSALIIIVGIIVYVLLLTVIWTWRAAGGRADDIMEEVVRRMRDGR